MYKVILLLFAGAILGSCQGTPRYGGGLYGDEGSRANRSKESSRPSDYAVEPIALGKIIDKYLGTPYAGASQEQRGYDCSEFVGLVYEEYASIHLPRTTDKLWRTGKKIEPTELFFGDLVFFDTGGRGVSHVGIYVGFNEFVHASQSSGVVISSITDKYYGKRYVGARRVME